MDFETLADRLVNDAIAAIDDGSAVADVADAYLVTAAQVAEMAIGREAAASYLRGLANHLDQDGAPHGR